MTNSSIVNWRAMKEKFLVTTKRTFKKKKKKDASIMPSVINIQNRCGDNFPLPLKRSVRTFFIKNPTAAIKNSKPIRIGKKKKKNRYSSLPIRNKHENQGSRVNSDSWATVRKLARSFITVPPENKRGRGMEKKFRIFSHNQTRASALVCLLWKHPDILLWNMNDFATCNFKAGSYVRCA